ncbi:MFS transporter [Paenibacillus flagellatus]|uniref:MFS transporter n=1 Tax=Paenibacillus flagellatus TaxID=2211139 RepID=A0A2V5K9M5_9BACL|nr:MFS transporter [Paenibacillus flagellatus]PYI50520.1 MFS transporter [Paenibacillus flagellatus]
MPVQPSTALDKKADLLSVASVPLIMTLGNSMFIPVLPVIQGKLGLTSLQTSLIITVYAITAILLIPIAGLLSDRYGRRMVMIPSLIVTAAGGLISGVAALYASPGAYGFILLGRFIQGIGASGAFPIVLPLVGDLFRDEKQVSKGLGLIETANTFGKVLSPVLGAALAAWLWYAPFFSIPLLCAIAIVLLALFLKVPPSDERPPGFKALIRPVLLVLKEKKRWLLPIFAAGGIVMFVLFGFLFHLSSMLEKQYGIDGVVKGLLIAIPLLMLCTASYIAGKGVGENKTAMKWIAVTGMAAGTAAMLAIAWIVPGSVASWLVWYTVAGVGFGVALPALDALITEGIQKKQRGSITSIYSSMRFIGVAAGPPAAAVLTRYGHGAVFYTFAALCAVAALIAFVWIKPGQGTKESRRKSGVHVEPFDISSKFRSKSRI